MNFSVKLDAHELPFLKRDSKKLELLLHREDEILAGKVQQKKVCNQVTMELSLIGVTLIFLINLNTGNNYCKCLPSLKN